MDFDLSEEQRSIQGLARDLATQQFAPNAADWDEHEIFPKLVLQDTAKLGLAGICVAPEVGGSGLDRTAAAIIFEELASGCASTAAYISIHNMVAWMIDHYGSDSQRHMWLPRLCSMDYFASYCLTEPDAGSDPASLSTRAVRSGDYYILNGSKAFISGGSQSDLYLCMVRTGDAGAGGISCIVVEMGTSGLSFGRLERKLGWGSQPTTMVNFSDCRVPTRNLIGAEGDGFKIAMQGLDAGRLNIAACSIGAARYCLDLSRQHLLARKQFGNRLSEFQALQFKIADMATELEAARLLVWRASHEYDMGAADATLYAAMAKRLATDVGYHVVNEALQLHGGYGYMKDLPIERFLRDVRVHQILEGTNEVMRIIIARKLLDL